MTDSVDTDALIDELRSFQFAHEAQDHGDAVSHLIHAPQADLFKRAADEIDALRARAERAEAVIDEIRAWRSTWKEWTTTWDTEDGGPSTYATGLDGLDAILSRVSQPASEVER